MKQTVRVALGSVVALLACDGVPVAPGNTGRLVVATVSQASVALDAGKVIVVGPSSSPTTKTVNATPGQTVTIDDLQPGSYTVALQGFVGGAVAMFGQTSGVQVVGGQDRRATVSFNSFVPAADPLPSSATGKTFTVSYAGVAGAARYQVEAATDQAFTANKVSVDVAGSQTSVNITVPNYGTFYARVRAMDAYQGTGQWATVPGSVTLKLPLRIDALSLRPGSVLTIGGLEVSYTVTIANETGGILSGMTLQGFIDQGTASRAAGGRGLTGCGTADGDLAPGTCTMSNLSLVASNATAGTGTLVAGSATARIELREGTVVHHTVTVPVTLDSRAPDLVISAPASLTVAPTSVVPGGTVTLSPWTVANQGKAASNAFSSGFYLSTDETITTDDVFLDGNANDPLAAGASFNWGGPTLTIPASTAPGSYFIGILVDKGNATVESNEGNNFKSTALTVIARADLVISAPPTLTVTPTSVVQGGTVTLSAWTLTNQGGAYSDNFGIGFYLSTDATIVAGSSDRRLGGYNAALSGGQSLPQPTSTLTIPADVGPGNYFIGILLDEANTVPESNEGNNSKNTELTVTKGVADLVISAPATFSVTPTSVAPGGTVTVPAWTVLNQGTLASNPFLNGTYLSTDATIRQTDRRIGGFGSIGPPPLAPGASFSAPTETVTIPSDVAPGAYYVGVLVDETNTTPESNEENNYKSAAVTVTGPDLMISSWGVPPVTPTTVTPGATVSLAGLTVFNQGTVASNAFRVGFYLSADTTLSANANDLFLSGTPAAALAPASQVTIPPPGPLTIPASIAPGKYFIGPLLDDLNSTAESDEGNNFKSTALTIVAATIFQATFSNDAVGAAPGAPEIGTWQQAPNAGTITVRQAVGDLTNKPVELNQLNGLTGGVGLYGHVAGSAPTTGSYVASWRSLVHGNAVGASVVVRDNAALIVAAVSISPNGSLRYNNTVLPSVSWVSDNSQLFEIIVDLDARVTSLRINGSAVTGAQNVAFFQSAAANVASLNFETGGTSAQTFAWDDIKVARLTP